ncbi:hypothetical protein ACW9KT_15645 [Hymenobacter sp. HD11105]
MTTEWLLFILGLIASVIIGIITSLLKRSLDGIDKKMDSTCAAVELMKLEMAGYSELTKYLKSDVEHLKRENKTLFSSHAAIDKHIAVQEALKAVPRTPLN